MADGCGDVTAIVYYYNMFDDFVPDSGIYKVNVTNCGLVGLEGTWTENQGREAILVDNLTEATAWVINMVHI